MEKYEEDEEEEAGCWMLKFSNFFKMFSE